MILIKVSIIQKRKKQIFSSMEIWGIEEIKKERERERRGGLAAGALPDYVEPSTRDSCPE